MNYDDYKLMTPPVNDTIYFNECCICEYEQPEGITYKIPDFDLHICEGCKQSMTKECLQDNFDVQSINELNLN